MQGRKMPLSERTCCIFAPAARSAAPNISTKALVGTSAADWVATSIGTPIAARAQPARAARAPPAETPAHRRRRSPAGDPRRERNARGRPRGDDLVLLPREVERLPLAVVIQNRVLLAVEGLDLAGVPRRVVAPPPGAI